MKNSIANFQNEIAKLEEEKLKVLARIDSAQSGKEETVIIYIFLLKVLIENKAERKNNMNMLKQLKDQYEAKQKEIGVFKKNDSENLTKLEKEKEGFKKKANEWTGNNIFRKIKFI